MPSAINTQAYEYMYKYNTLLSIDFHELSKESMQDAIYYRKYLIHMPEGQESQDAQVPYVGILAYYQLSRIPNEATHKWTSENAAGLDVLESVVDDSFGKLLHEVVRDKHGP